MMSRLLFPAKRLFAWAAALTFAALSVVAAFPNTVFAAGENYAWSPTDNAIINVTGGDLQPSTLKTTAANGNNFFGTFKYKTGCNFDVQVLLNFSGSGYLSLSGAVGGSGPANECDASLVQSYKNQPVQVTGTRAVPGVETELQKVVNITLYSPDSFDKALPSVNFTIKKSTGATVTTLTLPKESRWLGGGDMPAQSEQAAAYSTGQNKLKLDPGLYQVCFSAIITQCQNFQKVLYLPFAHTYGTPYLSSTVNRNIAVKVELTYASTVGDGKTIGPVNLNLLGADEQVVKSTATGSFTKENCSSGATTPSATCQAQGTTATSTTTLAANFDDADPGTYKVCIANTETCQNVTKVVRENANITLKVTGDVAQAIADGSLSAGQGDPLCDEQNSGSQGWLFCGWGQTMLDAINGLDEWIFDHVLHINTGDIFVDGGAGSSGRGFKTAWSIFRNIAYALFIILGLIMIISQILGLDVFDAYTIRKMLPKLVAAAIFIPLLWPLLKIVFDMANDSASAIYELILAPFGGVGTEITLKSLFTGAGAVGGVAVGAFFAIGGWGVFLAACASILLALLSALVILATRDIGAYILIIASPIAVICATFEPFKKVFTFWKTFLLTILLSLPAVAAVLAASKVAAKIAIAASHNAGDNLVERSWGILLAIIFLGVGYALFWKVFQALDKVSGQVGNLLSNVTGKAQKALSDYRGNTLKKRWNEGIEGRRNLGFFGAGNLLTGLGRRARMTDEAGLGAWGVGRRGRAKYAEAVRTMQAGVAAKMMEQDHDRAGGDDDAMRLLTQRGMTESRFLRDYSELQMRGGATREVADARARRALGLSQTSLGARVGTNAMRIAAARSLLKSNTSYRSQWVQDPDGSWRQEDMDYHTMSRQMYGDIGALVEDGLVTASDGAAIIKSNAARADRAGVGFGQAIRRVDQVASGAELSLADTTEMADEALQGTGPYQLIGQRHEAIRLLGPEMHRRLEAAYRDYGPDSPQFIQQVAAAAGRRDLAAQLPELNAGLNAGNVEAITLGGRQITQWEEDMRNNPIFQRYRREYANAYAAAAAGGAAPPGGAPGAPPGAPPGGVPPPGAAPGP